MTEETAITPLLQAPPRWALMGLLAGVLFFAGKLAVAWPLRKSLGWNGTLSFAFLWVGMDARPFLRKRAMEKGQPAPSNDDKKGAGSPFSIREAAGCILLGTLLLWLVARHFTHPLAQGWCGMVGLILILHFGAFGVLAAFWQSRGIGVTPIMNHPATATSLADFWGRRWNVAFHDLAHPLVFRPVAGRWGQGTALWASFLVSGLAHELVISVPAGAGFGLPTAYFLLQALGIVIERRLFSRRPASTHRMGRWFFTHAFTALPALFLFHPPFVERVMIPFFHAIGALS